MKKILIGLAGLTFTAAIALGVYTHQTRITDSTLLANISALSHGENVGTTAIPLTHNVNDPMACTLEIMLGIQVKLADGTFDFKYQKHKVRGMENTCRFTGNASDICNAFACFSSHPGVTMLGEGEGS